MSEKVLNKKKILLVEDDPLLVKMYTVKFVKAGFDVVTAFDGEMGYDLAMKENFDILILDVMLPKLSGIDLLAKLRAIKAAEQVPVIFLSNLTNQEEISKAKKLGAKEFLIKANLTPSNIVEVVKKYITV